MAEYADSKTALVGDVDCTAAGKSLCNDVGVQGFPTIKYGDPSSLEDYDGGRDLKALQTFAAENLKPLCGPENMDLCDQEKKTLLEGFMAKSKEELESEIEKKETEMKEAEQLFEAEVKKLQETYEQLDKEKDEKKAAVKASGLGMMKAVKAARSRNQKKEEEL